MLNKNIDLEKIGVIKDGKIDYKKVNEILSNCDENDKQKLCDLITSKMETQYSHNSNNAPVNKVAHEAKPISYKGHVIDCSSFSMKDKPADMTAQEYMDKFVADHVPPHEQIWAEMEGIKK